MKIERHRVDEESLRTATDGFTERIGRSVLLEQEGGRDPFGWRMIGDDLLDYAAARSAADPRIDRDAWTALLSAAEAHLGAVELEAVPLDVLSVSITYTGTGVVYRETSEDGERTGRVREPDWTKALYLWVVTSDPRTRRAAFLRTAEDAGLSPFGRALRDLVFGDGERAADLLGTPRLDEERALHALATGDRDAFWAAIAALLRAPRGDARPRTLLPLAPLALTALAVRDRGWERRIESDYLPPRLTGGDDSVQRPRVGPYGTGRKPFPVPITVERPPFPQATPEMADHFDGETPRRVEKIWEPPTQAEYIPYLLVSQADLQLIRFSWRAELDPEGRDPRQREALELASQFTAAAYRVATAPGESVEVTIGDRTVPAPTAPITDHLSNFVWHRAIALALITASRERRDLLLSVDPDDLTSEWDLPVHHTYHVALRAYLRGEPARPATDRAIAAVEDAKATHPHHLGPFAVLLSQLVAGDREGFAAALADALEDFRDHYGVGDRAEDPDRQIHIGALALACHARRDLGWEIPVASAYLPAGIMEPRAAAAGSADR